MKQLTVSIFLLILSYNAFSQSREVYEHSNSFQQIAEKYEKRAVDISSKYKYYNYSVEKKDLPVLNEAEKNIIGKDNFYIYWLSGINNDINFLFLCNYNANEAIIFSFRKEHIEGYKPYSDDEIKSDIFYLFLSKYLDAKWIGLE